MSDSEDEKVEVHLKVDAVTKYRLAADIANKAMEKVIAACKAEAEIVKICALGDEVILEETGKLYKKKVKKEDEEKAEAVKKGIAFPTCVSVGNCVCHYSPILSDPQSTLADGDLVKIDLGAHVDGYIAVVAHTLVVGASKEKPAEGKKADAVVAAHLASELAHRMVVAGGKNNDVTLKVQKIAEAYGCKPIEGMLSHQLEQNVIDGEKTIILNPADSIKSHAEKTFEEDEAYALDMFVSTGDGKAKQMETRTTVFKKTPNKYQLKMKASRAVFSEIAGKFDVMPFTLRLLSDEKTARMGVVECTKHELVTPFTVLYEKEGEQVAQFKFTVLLTPNGPMRLTKDFHQADAYKSEKTLEDEEIKAILAKSASSKKKNKKKKKAAAAATGDDKAEA